MTVDEVHRTSEAIQVSGLTKYYDDLLAVDHISFAVPQGQVFGFLGPNGAGKTTTIRMLTGLTRPTEGSARVLGFDLAREVTRIKKCIGVVPETSNLYDELSARDNLVFTGQLYGVPRRERGERADALLRRFRLWEKRNTPFGKLSKGMKRALTVAAALVHRPQLVFLDEPTTGLDILSARSLRALIRQLREEGVTVFLTTHYLEEAERLCDQVALIVQGRIVALDTVEGLKARLQRRAAVEVTVGPSANEGVSRLLRFAAEDVPAALRLALAEAEHQGRPVLSVRTVEPTLEDAFIELTGLSAEVMLAEKGRR
ncbi:MAG: ABC transporter ATP-binding protein [Anaerolineae bacterium]